MTQNTQNQAQELINKKLVFLAESEEVNHYRELIVKIDITDSYFSSLKISYVETQWFTAGYYKKKFSYEAKVDKRQIDYYESMGDMNSITTFTNEFKRSYTTVDEEAPLVFEEDYIQNENMEKKWQSGNISVEEAKKMIELLIDYYEPEEVKDPVNAFERALLEFVNDIINDSEFKFEVKVEDVKE